MNQELVEVTDSIDNLDILYKVQHIRLIDLPINFNSSTAEPFFVKSALDYDKYELPTVISYDQFDTLFRPFKNSNIFKRYLICRKVSKYQIYAAIVFLLLLIYMKRTQVNQQAISIFGWLFTFLYFLIASFSIRVQVTFFTELQVYCPTIQHENVTVQLINGIACFCLKDYLHFEIRSKVVQEDCKKIKIYLTKGSNTMISVGDKETIFERKNLLFEENLLAKFVTFEEFQMQIRAFKDNQTYKAIIFWKRSILVLFFLTALIFFKLLFSYFALSQVLFISSIIYIFFKVKELKSKSKMAQQMITFCDNVSFDDERVEVIACLRENPQKRRCLPLEDELYCFEIRFKDHGHSQ